MSEKYYSNGANQAGEDLKNQEENRRFLIDDFYYRRSKFHPTLDKQRLLKIYENIPVNYQGYYGDKHGFFRPSNNQNIVGRVYISEAASPNTTLAHEVRHYYQWHPAISGKNKKSEYTEKEKQYLQEAYSGLSAEDYSTEGSWLDEAGATNTELRRKISEENNNVIGAALDEVIDKIPEDKLLQMYINQNAYTAQDIGIGKEEPVNKDLLMLKDNADLGNFYYSQRQAKNHPWSPQDETRLQELINTYKDPHARKARKAGITDEWLNLERRKSAHEHSRKVREQDWKPFQKFHEKYPGLFKEAEGGLYLDYDAWTEYLNKMRFIPTEEGKKKVDKIKDALKNVAYINNFNSTNLV